MALWKIDWLI